MCVCVCVGNENVEQPMVGRFMFPGYCTTVASLHILLEMCKTVTDPKKKNEKLYFCHHRNIKKKFLCFLVPNC